MSSQLSTRYAWKAFHGLKALRLTPTVNELPPSIKYAIAKDEANLKPVFEHAIQLRLSNGGMTITTKHSDNISVDLQRDSTTISEQQKNDSELFKALLDSKETKHWDPEFKQLLADIQKTENPVEAFEQMTQSMDPQLRQVIINLMRSVHGEEANEEAEALDNIINTKTEELAKLASNTAKRSSVFDSILVKRLQPEFIAQENKKSYESHFEKLKNGNPFERADMEFNTLNPIEAMMEISSLFQKLEEGSDNSNADEAEAMRRFTQFESNLSENFESIVKQTKSEKFSAIASRYKAMTEALRDPNRVKFLDEREEQHLRQYYTKDLKKLPNIVFASFTELLNYSEVEQLISEQADNKNAAQIVKENLRKQYENYLELSAPLRELNRKFVEDQQAYLPKERAQLAKLAHEAEGLEEKLFVADFHDYATDPIVDRLSQIQHESVTLLLTYAQTTIPNNETVKTVSAIVQKLIDLVLKQRQNSTYKQLRRYAMPHPFSSYLQQFANLDSAAFIKQEEAMVNELEKAVDSALSADKFQSLTKELKSLILSIDTNLTLERAQIVKNNLIKKNLNEVYEVFQRYGTKQFVTQFKHIQELREEENKRYTPESIALQKAQHELALLAQKKILEKGSVQKGLLDGDMTSKVMEVLQAFPQIKNDVRQMIAPKKYFSEERQSDITGRVAYPCKIETRSTMSAMPQGYRRKGDKRVLLTARVSDLGLTDVQKERLAIVAGPKYIKKSNIIRFSVRMFETPEEGVAYARQYLHELVEAAKNENLSIDKPVTPAPVDPFEGLKQQYAEFDEESTQSTEALEKWIMYKETGKKAVGADLTYGEGVREVVWKDQGSKSLRDEYGYNIAEGEEEEEFELSDEESD
jgi:hypothetical protein